MDTFVENSGVAEQEKQIQVVPTENEKNIQVPVENAEISGAPPHDTVELHSQGGEPAQEVNFFQAEKPDPSGRKTIDLPLNEMKAGYDYAFRKGGSKR